MSHLKNILLALFALQLSFASFAQSVRSEVEKALQQFQVEMSLAGDNQIQQQKANKNLKISLEQIKTQGLKKSELVAIALENVTSPQAQQQLRSALSQTNLEAMNEREIHQVLNDIVGQSQANGANWIGRNATSWGILIVVLAIILAGGKGSCEGENCSQPGDLPTYNCGYAWTCGWVFGDYTCGFNYVCGVF
jgi:hypothetical protein